MTLKILVVDDSPFFQRRLAEIINEHPQLQVVGFANNGREAIDKVKQLKPDLVTMDYEMPMMDGVTAVKIIMDENPLPILMLSSMTFPDAKITIDALEAGAVDFITKNFSEISNKSISIKKHLYKTLLAIGEKTLASKKSHYSEDSANDSSSHSTALEVKKSEVENFVKKTTVSNHSTVAKEPIGNTASTPAKKAPVVNKPKLLVIGASTGGPAALSQLLRTIPATFPLPIIIIQHMPENFTQAFADRLNNQCQLSVKQASDGDTLRPGHALLAPGGRQLIIDKNDAKKVRVIDSKEAVNYKPCVDITFASVSNSYGKNTLAIVLTGMGQDGRDGARLLKQQQATVWTQNKETCVVYGMPMAIDKVNLSDASLSITDLSNNLLLL